MSRNLVHMVSHLNVVSRIESKHMPVEMKFKLSNTFYDVANKPRKYQLQRYVWDQTKAQEYSAMCNGAEWSKDKTQAAESIKWRPLQAYGSNQFLLVQPQTVFSTHKIITLTHR